MLSRPTKDLFPKPAASAGTDCPVSENTKLLCGLQTSLCLVPFQDPSWLMLFFAPCLSTAGHQVCFKHHHLQANLYKGTQYTLHSLSSPYTLHSLCCLQGQSFNYHRVNLQTLYLCFALFNFLLLDLGENGVKKKLHHRKG